MACAKTFPEEITCEIIKYFPYSKLMEILDSDTYLKKMVFDNFNYIVCDYIKKRADHMNSYLLYNAFHYFYNPADQFEKKFTMMKLIHFSLHNNFQINPEYNTIIKFFFDFHQITPHFITIFYKIHILFQFPYDIALDAVSHMNNDKIIQMLVYSEYYNDENKYNNAYTAVFEHNNDDNYSIKHQITVFKKIVKRAKLSLIETAYCAGELELDDIYDFFNFIEMGINPYDACALILVEPDYSMETMNNAIKLIIQYNISVEFAIESSANFNDEQMKIFKAFVKTNKDIDTEVYNFIMDKSAIRLKCLDYLVKHRLVSKKNGEFFAEKLSEEQCQKTLDLIEHGVKFYKIINCMTLEKIALLLNSLHESPQILLEDLLHLNLYEDDENYVEQEYEDICDIKDYYNEENKTNHLL